jgi:ABC transport system ATP-binding/permease protein
MSYAATRDAPWSEAFLVHQEGKLACDCSSSNLNLSFKERKELESLPARIEALELEIQELHEAMAESAFYKRDGAAIAPTNARLGELEAELANVYARWETFEGTGD